MPGASAAAGERVRLDAYRLRELAEAVLRAHDAPAGDAAAVADCLLAADLAGVRTHGVVRLPFYCSRLQRGLIAARPAPRVVADWAAAAVLDAGNGLGPLGGRRGMEIAMAKARGAGVGACGVYHSNHLGMLGWYVEAAAREGLVALAFGNAPASMAPPGARTPLLGTNPFAAGFPTTSEPVVVDLATSQVARARITAAHRAGAPIPHGWALDAEGRPTTDAGAALAGSVLPLGGPKGFALALVVEALAGVLTGAAVGPELTGTVSESNARSNTGHLFVALDPSAFGEGFRQRMAVLVELVHSAEPVDAEAPIRVPGDRRRRNRQEALAEGLEVDRSLVEELEALAAG